MTFTNVLESQIKFVICLESSKVGSEISCAYQCGQVGGNRGNQIESNCSAIQYHLSKKVYVTGSSITMPNTFPCIMAVVFTL